MKYRADIDGLRGIAIISVVAFHAYPLFFVGGFTGVDIFFVISGYLITTIILNDLSDNIFSLKEFYIRRIRRIFPALLLLLLFCLIFGWFSLLAEEYKQLGEHILGGSTFTSNLIYWKEIGYFDNVAEKKPLLHLWSLAIEEQFYIIWPILILYLWRRQKYFLIIISSLASISLILNILSIKENISAAFFLPYTRFWELIIGSIAAYLTWNKNKTHRICNFYDKAILMNIYERVFKNNLKILCEALSIIGMILIIGSIFFISKKFEFPGWWALFPTIGAVMLITCRDAWVNKFILSNKILVQIGLISFPLYLWHWTVLSFARIIVSNDLSIVDRSFCIFLSIILAIFTYNYIEKPIRNKNKNKNILILILILILIIISVGAYLVKREDGFKNRIILSENIRKQFDWDPFYNRNIDCQKKFPGDDYCNIYNINSSPNVAIIGDSHANHFFLGLSEHYKKVNKNLINMGSGGCPPLIGIRMSGPSTSPNCYERMSPVFNFVINSKNIDKVYIAFWHSAYFADYLQYKDMIGNISAKNNYEYFFKAIDRTITILQKKGKKVIIIYDLPDLKENIKDCFIKRPFFPKKNCTYDESIFVNDFNEYDLLINDLVLRNKVEIFYTHKYLNGNFPVDMFGIPTYRDYSHLSINGSLFFSDKFH